MICFNCRDYDATGIVIMHYHDGYGTLDVLGFACDSCGDALDWPYVDYGADEHEGRRPVTFQFGVLDMRDHERFLHNVVEAREQALADSQE